MRTPTHVDDSPRPAGDRPATPDDPAHLDHAAHPDHPLRGRLNAAFFRLLDRHVDRWLGDRKRALLTDLPLELVELGPGVGANFRYLAPGTTVTAVEPNRRMHPGLRRQARLAGIHLQLVERGAEATGLPDACTDVVLCTLVLCTVQDPAAAVAEAARLLRPGGRLLVLEHVAAPEGSATRRLQRLVQPTWSWLFEGCRVDRDTAALLRAAPFRSVSVEPWRARTPFLPINTQIAAVAVR